MEYWNAGVMENQSRILSLFETTCKRCLKNVDHVQWQGVARFESGAYTLVREHLKL